MRYKWLIFLFLITGCTQDKYHYGTGYYAPCWNADGTRIYYFRNDLTEKEIINWPFSQTYKCEKNEWYICSCKPDGSDRREISKMVEFSGELGGGGSMDISPKGKIVYSLGKPKSAAGIWTIDIDGTNKRYILQWGEYPRWSFNCTKIIFGSDGEQEGIWMMDEEGDNLQQVIEKGTRPSFCENTKTLLYNKGRWIWSYSFVDSSTDSVTNQPNNAFWPEWLPSCEEFVYTDYALYLYSFTNGTYKLLNSIGDYRPRVFEDKIAVEDEGIWVLNVDGTAARKILK